MKASEKIIEKLECKPVPPPGNLSSQITKSFKALVSVDEYLPAPEIINCSSNISSSGEMIMKVQVIVFIPEITCLTDKDVTIYWDKKSSPDSFYITYNKSEVVTYNYRAYEVNFDVLYCSSDTFPSLIEIYLWDEDPVTSRGTVTTVQPS
ncbi:hypothetical protein [uncultured Aquimarina sp.]|uniref:hypothetical protein n=1 Tax=uncultured Aquimarina sp. TaxID=575652 RepID=UPI00260B0186|nr:hypothetical protein [uncultured Aquimarina sp.]